MRSERKQGLIVKDPVVHCENFHLERDGENPAGVTFLACVLIASGCSMENFITAIRLSVSEKRLKSVHMWTGRIKGSSMETGQAQHV